MEQPLPSAALNYLSRPFQLRPSCQNTCWFIDLESTVKGVIEMFSGLIYFFSRLSNFIYLLQLPMYPLSYSLHTYHISVQLNAALNSKKRLRTEHIRHLIVPLCCYKGISLESAFEINLAIQVLNFIFARFSFTNTAYKNKILELLLIRGTFLKTNR